MMAAGYTFDADGARRIIETVRRVEATPTGSAAPRSGWRPQEHTRLRFKLTSTLEPNGSATATVRVFDQSTLAYIDTTQEVTVWDVEGIFSGSAGALGRAESFSDSGRLEIYQLPCEL